MKPNQCIEISDWVSCSGGLPLGSSDISPLTDLDVEVLFECEMVPHEESSNEDVINVISFPSYLVFFAKITNLSHVTLQILGYDFKQSVTSAMLFMNVNTYSGTIFSVGNLRTTCGMESRFTFSYCAEDKH